MALNHTLGATEREAPVLSSTPVRKARWGVEEDVRHFWVAPAPAIATASRESLQGALGHRGASSGITWGLTGDIKGVLLWSIQKIKNKTISFRLQ
jgi:hypothetical protein